MTTRDGEALLYMARKYRMLADRGVEPERLSAILESMQSILNDGEGDYWAFEFPHV